MPRTFSMNLATSRQSLNNVVIESDGVRNLRRDERSRSCLRRRICVRFREELFSAGTRRVMPTRSWPTSEQARTTRSDSVGIFQLDLFAAGAYFHLIAKMKPSLLQRLSPSRKIGNLEDSPGSSRRAPACDHLALAGNPKPRDR